MMERLLCMSLLYVNTSFWGVAIGPWGVVSALEGVATVGVAIF